MELLMLFACVVSVLKIHAKSECWFEAGDGSSCEYEGTVLEPGQSYEQTEGLPCFTCTCHDGVLLRCCYTGIKATSFPNTCKLVQRGCDEVAVSKDNEDKPCSGKVSYKSAPKYIF